MVGMWRSLPILSWRLEPGCFLRGSVTTSSLLRPVVFGTKRQFWEKKDLGKERQVLPRQLTGSKLIVSCQLEIFEFTLTAAEFSEDRLT